MAILENAMNPQAGAQAGAMPAQGQPNPDQITSPVVQSHMDEIQAMEAAMPPEMKQAYDQVLIAGKKMLYGKEAAQAVDSIMADDNIPVPNKLGEGVANLVVMMDNQGNGTIPKEVIIPVAVTLMFEAADFMHEVGIEVTEQDIGEALKLMLYGVFEAYGMPADQLDKMVDDLAGQLDLGGEAEMESEEMDSEEMDEDAAMEQGFNKQRGM